MVTKKPATYIAGFNGLRALAVTLVFLVHKVHDVRIQALNLPEVGVWMFFVLSGYLIIGELHRQRRAIDREARSGVIGKQVRTFFIRRALRIFPAYYVLLIALLILRRFYEHVGPDLGFAYHFSYLSNYWIAVVVRHWVGPFSIFWSLAIEQQFYLLAPFVFLMTRSKWHPAICIATIFLGAAGHAALYAAHVGAIGRLVLSPLNFTILAIGGLGYILAHSAPLKRALRGALPLMAGIAGIVFFAGHSLFLGAADPGDNPWFDYGLACCIAILVLWVSQNQQSRVVAWLEFRPIAYLGTISYGFYLLHAFIPNPLGRALVMYAGVHLNPELVETLGVLMDFAAAVVAASLSWRLVEAPIIALYRRASPAKAHHASPTALGNPRSSHATGETGA